MEAIFSRTSVRDYEARPVEDEKIQQLLKAAMAAPSAGNQQPWEFYVVKDKAILGKLARSSPFAGCAKLAPLAIVACYNTTRLRMPEYAAIDLSAAVENILLEAVTLGLGAVWLGIAPLQDRMQAVKDILEMPEEFEAFAILPIGYPKHEQLPQDRFDKRRIHYKE